MGLLAFPQMLKARYDTAYASGVICAGGIRGARIVQVTFGTPPDATR